MYCNGKVFRSCLTSACLIILLQFASPLMSQMPEWKFYRDRDGNTYYIDRSGKIRTSGKPEFNFKPVSPQGIDYYLNHAEQLLKGHYKVEGLILLKSILALPVSNNRVYKAQTEAAKRINYIKKREGGRFNGLNEMASLMLIKNSGNTVVINDNMFYSIEIPGTAAILRSRFRKRPYYRYHGLLIGINLKKSLSLSSGTDPKFDLLLAVDSERYSVSLKSIKRVVNNWRTNLGFENISREEVKKDRNSYILRFYKKEKPLLSGFEGYFFNGKFGYMVRAISSGEKFTKFKDKIRDIIFSFKFVELKSQER